MFERLLLTAEWLAVAAVVFFFLNKLSYKFWEKCFGYCVAAVVSVITVGNLVNWIVTGDGKIAMAVFPYVVLPWMVAGVMHIYKGVIELKKSRAQVGSGSCDITVESK